MTCQLFSSLGFTKTGQPTNTVNYFYPLVRHKVTDLSHGFRSRLKDKSVNVVIDFKLLAGRRGSRMKEKEGVEIYNSK